MKRYPRTFSKRPASQSHGELSSFIKILQTRHVTKYLEIGARHGDTFHEVMINLPKGSYGMAVDLPGGLWGKSMTHTALQKACDDLRKRGYAIDMILGDSTKIDVIERIRQSAPYDAALIDGDHTYNGVKKDWDNYRSMANLVAFHDIAGTGQKEKVFSSPVEVPILWAEIKQAGIQTTELIDRGSAMGIGVCFP